MSVFSLNFYCIVDDPRGLLDTVSKNVINVIRLTKPLNVCTKATVMNTSSD